LVLRSQGHTSEARAALSDLCAAYYDPVLAFIRGCGHTPDSARDLAHGFFARILAGDALRPDPQRGRFRSYLLGAVKHFLSDRCDHDAAAKRGGGFQPVALDSPSETSPGLELPDPNSLPPDRAFDRRWALTVLDRALASISADHAAAGKEALFHALKPWLTGDTDGRSQADTGKLLGISEGAVKVAIHRLRQKFREAVKSEIAQTVTSDDDVRDELRYLLSVV
jgi:DNA-directed RNA polymerase specialized sigma24 family protein